MKDDSPFIIITCEHGGNQIPQNFKYLFSNSTAVLDTHCGYDPGALELSRMLSLTLDAPLIYETISRLLIDQNRSLTNRKLLSDHSRNCPTDIRDTLIANIYKPYHDRLHSAISKAVDNQKQVFHFSIHTFTPIFDGLRRNCDIGILYDPSRASEKIMSDSIIKLMKSINQPLTIRRNYPYKGTSDGLVTSLRKKFAVTQYCGIEIECNHESYLKKTSRWSAICSLVVKALKTTLSEISL